MNEASDERLSRITTLWSLVRQAHGAPGDAASTARRELLERYCGAAFRYLLGALRNEDAAQDLFQEFALRFARGDFRRTDPARGRFRDYLKTALIHLVSDCRKSQAKQPGPLPADLATATPPAADSTDLDFITIWREELLNRTWDALAQANATLHAVLLVHVENPDSQSPKLAEQLAARLGKQFTAGNVRVSLHRAREQFADLLIKEVQRSLGSPCETELLDELRELHLLKYCTPALERRAHRATESP